MKLLTSDTALAGLWALVQAKRRKGSTTLNKVPADALENLLKDHHTLFTAKAGERVEIGPDQTSLT